MRADYPISGNVILPENLTNSNQVDLIPRIRFDNNSYPKSIGNDFSQSFDG